MLPKTIRVGWLDYRVQDWDVLEASAEGKDGDCDKTNSVIRVCQAYGPARTAEILLHEVLHACWDMGSLGARETEEKAVTSCSRQLAQVWRDNPQLIAFLSASLSVPSRKAKR